MAYGKKYILSFVSDRGNDYKVEVLQQGYGGAAVSKNFGETPVLNIEEGDGRVKGSSLTFSIQADVEGELSGLYTTDNKEYKVLLYRNSSLYWQGYILPELYSENYVDPPYDVAVTATDQLATLKDIDYQSEDVQTSLLDIIKGILLNTKVDIPCKIHMQLSTAQGSLLKTSYISAAAYNGQNCYDVLNAILLSCNCCIMQFGNKWLIASYTDASTSYITEGESEQVQHCTIGQMGKADVCPIGSLTMVNAPALKGATVEYNHILRNSILLNPNCINRDNWSYDAETVGDRFPGEVQGTDVVYKCYFWQLDKVNLTTSSTLQVWQDVKLNVDTSNAYSLSLKYLFTGLAEVLLLSVAYSSEYGTTWYLTGDGWSTSVDRNNINSYIQITGEAKSDVLLLQGVSDMSKYDTATVQFMLPDVPGTLRVGFINCTTDYSDPLPYRVDQIYVTDIYLTVANVTGKTATTLVERNATSSQEEVTISYGEPISSSNADKVDLSYLRDADGQQIESVVLAGREYDSYYLAMVQEFSRFYGVKKMQLQGSLMGADVLHPLYHDIFSGKVMRLVSGQYNLLEDSLGISLDEVPTAFVEYTLVVYAKDNAVSNNTTSAGGSVAVSGGDNYFGLQADGDVFVKSERPLTGHESRFENVALPTQGPNKVSSERTYIYSSDPKKYPSVNLADIFNRVKSLEDMFEWDGENIKAKANFYSIGGVSSGGNSSTSGGSGTGSVVIYTPALTSGEHIGTIQIDGVAQKIYAPSLDSYATIDYVSEAIQNAKDTRVDTLINTTIPALRSDITTLRGEFDALNALLSDDVSGKINTWNEVVDFLDEYSESQDLATILSAINADIAKRALQTDLTSVKNTLTTEQGYIDTLQGYFTSGAANNALKLGGQLPSYYATASALATTNSNVTKLTTRVTTAEGNITSISSRVKALEDMFEWDGENIKAKANFYSVGGVSSGGNSNTEGGGSGGGSTVSWANTYTSANGLKIAAITIDGVDTNVYTAKALSQYTNDVGYLTTHQPIYALTINNSAGTAQVTYTPNSKAASLTLTKAMVGLGNVENTALSTWVGTSKITTLGTITTGIWNGTKIANAYLANSSITISGTAVSLGGSITQAALRTALGLGSLAYKSSLVASDIPSLDWSKITSGKPTTLSGYGITDFVRSNVSDSINNYTAKAGIYRFSSKANSATPDNAGYGTSLTLYAGSDTWSQLYVSYYMAGSDSGVYWRGATTSSNTNAWRRLLDSNNYASYTYSQSTIDSKLAGYLPLSGGTITSTSLAPLMLTSTASAGHSILQFSSGSTYLGALGFKGVNEPYFRTVEGNLNTLIHSGNIGSYNAGSATKLQTARTIWGQSFNGSGNVYGTINNTYGILPDSDSSHDIGSASKQYRYVYARWFGAKTGDSLSFGANNGTHISIKTSGNVLIGTTTDNGEKLQVGGTIKSVGGSNGSAIALFPSGSVMIYAKTDGDLAGGVSFYTNDGTTLLGTPAGVFGANTGVKRYYYGGNYNTAAMYIFANGNVSIGGSITDMGAKLYVNGNFLATGDVISGSDARYKAIESYAEIDIETIANAPIINFKWTDREDARVHLGSTAQYWYGTPLRNGVIPTDSKELWTMGYGQIALASVVSVAKKVVNHEDRIKALEMENRELRQQLEQYRRA